MNGLISLTALATTVALGGPDGSQPISEIELHTSHHSTREECALAPVTIRRPTHVDPLTWPGSRNRCLDRARVRGRCIHAQVSVVRDHDRSLLVDVELEPNLGPAPDATQQRRAEEVAGLRERGAILARWPAGAWHDLQICLDEASILRKRIEVPPRCVLLLGDYAGKPHPARLERPGERGCIVAVNPGPDTLAVYASIPPPAQGETWRHFRYGEDRPFPACVAAGSTARWRYGLVGEWGKAWHVAHNLVMWWPAEGECGAGTGARRRAQGGTPR